MRIFRIVVVIMAFLGCTSARGLDEEIAPRNVNVVFASATEGKKILTKEDSFLLGLSVFDRSARLQTSKEVNLKEFKTFIAEQTLDWTATDKEKINNAMIRINLAFSEYSLSFPKEIILIKTTGREEGGAAYCRDNNVIVLPLNIINNYSKDRLYDLILHELFHIFTRNNKNTQEALYAVLSFKKSNDLRLPNDLFQKKITNPDAVLNNYYFSAKVNGNEYKLMPILLSSSNYDERRGGKFFDYLKLYFIAVKEDTDATVPLTENDELVLFTPNQVPDYSNLIGKNTDYIIHPEEVLADNFVFLINKTKRLPNMEIVEKMSVLLKKP